MKMTKIRLLPRESLLRSHVPQGTMRTPVLQVNSCVAGLCPQEQWQPLIMYHGFGSLYDGSVLPLRNPVLLGVVRNSELPPNACLRTIVNKLSKGVLSSIVRPQGLDLPTCLCLHKSSKLLKPLEDLTLGLQEINPGPPGVIINE